VAVRAAVPGEEQAVLECYRWLFEAPGRTPPSWDTEGPRERLASAIAGEDSEILLALDSDQITGLCSAYIDLDSVRFGRRCWIEDLAVDPERRSQGIGKALLDAAKDWARQRGATHLELDTGLARTDAQRFYEREKPATTGYSYSWVL
jgi:GNAT superfamily N-acetyltransferase